MPVSETLGSARGLRKVLPGFTAELSVRKHYCRILCAQVGSSSGSSHVRSCKHTGLTEKQCKVEMTGGFHFFNFSVTFVMWEGPGEEVKV